MSIHLKRLLWVLAGAGAYLAVTNYSIAFHFVANMPRMAKEYGDAITAIATIVIAYVTFILADENRRLRKAGTEPEVVAYLTPHQDGTGGINFVLANIGQGAARNVKFNLEYDKADFSSHGVFLVDNPDRTAIGVLPQGEKVLSLFGISFRLAKGNDGKQSPLKPFDVIVTYDNLNGEPMRSTQTLSVAQFLGLPGYASKPYLKEIADSLNNIDKSLAALAKTAPHLKTIETTTISDTVVQKAKAGQ